MWFNIGTQHFVKETRMGLFVNAHTRSTAVAATLKSAGAAVYFIIGMAFIAFFAAINPKFGRELARQAEEDEFK